ncbi:hypothetical protein [Dyadobacter sp. CY312]|uniref:hypothetical protein n=1 Tax=Dyadobacter sp. CY312 TaxID=2907303 RepID=UPI001F41F217|nr:hypothetical protein [Dyadobacter sp. CY312]MCE7039276.1 hypothetical protein [Dyadobacter sp. CY312]
MSNLQIYGASGIPVEVEKQLQPVDRKIVSLARIDRSHNPKMSEQSAGQWKELIDNILLKAQVKLSLKPKTKEENTLLMACINEDLGTKFGPLTRLEVYAALDAGLDGRFLKEGESHVFFNPSNLVQWIKAWIVEVKQPVMSRVSSLKVVSEEIPAPSEREQMINAFRFFIQAVKSSRESVSIYQDYGGIVFSLLTKLELIDPVSKEDIEAVAVHQLHEAQIERDKSKIRNLKQVLSDMDSSPISAVNSVKSIAERKAIENKIRMIISWEEEDIVDYLTLVNDTLNEYFKSLLQ